MVSNGAPVLIALKFGNTPVLSLPLGKKIIFIANPNIAVDLKMGYPSWQRIRSSPMFRTSLF